MINHGKKNILGVLVSAVDYESAVHQVISAAKAGQNYLVSALAVHGVMTGVLDPEHRFRLNQFDLITPDGQPVRWALNLLYGTGLPDRVYGPTLTLNICAAATQQGIPVYFYGSQQSVLESLIQNLQEHFPSLIVAGYQPSRFRQVSAEEMEEIADEIRASGAAITFAGLGCPRQEVWAFEYRNLLPMPVVAVGAAFDFHAGTLPQAPPRLQNWGLEWAFRLLQEPQRLWKRYLYLNPLYVTLLAAQWLKVRQFNPVATIQPTEELRYG